MGKSKFSILRWNGKQGEQSVFVVRNNKTELQAEFTPGRVSDVVWLRKELNPDWESFQEEPVDNLEDVVF